MEHDLEVVNVATDDLIPYVNNVRDNNRPSPYGCPYG